MEELEKLINKDIVFIGKDGSETLKEPTYTIKTIKKEFENDKMNRVNFYLLPKFAFLHELNIKLNTKGKTTQEVFIELGNKTRDTLSENSFLKDAISFIRLVDKKANIHIKPIIYKKANLIFNISLDNIFTATEYNPKEDTVNLLTRWGIYNDHKNAVDFYLMYDNKKDSHKELLKLLINKEEISFDLLKRVASDTKLENKDKVYMFLERFLKKENLTKSAMIFKNRRKLYKIYKNFSEELPPEYKYITLKWIKEEVENYLLAKDPNKTNCIFDIEFKTASDELKKEVSDIEILAKKVWNYYEDKINSVLKAKNISLRIAIDTLDFFTDELNVKVITNNSISDEVIKTVNLKDDLVRIIKKTYKKD